MRDPVPSRRGGMREPICAWGGQVYTAVVSPLTLREGNYSSNGAEYNLLTELERLFWIHDYGN